MTYALVVSSRSGNTQEVADTVAAALAERGVAFSYQGAAPSGEDAAAQRRAIIDGADTIVAGFWTDKGDCAPEMVELLAELQGKRVFLFGTAGFGGSEGYFAQILDRVRAHLPEDARYLGGAMCQGKMGPAVRRRFEALLSEHPDDARAQAMIDNFDAALKHPDESDRARIAAAACTALAL